MAYSRTTAEAVNCLLHFSGKDQQALVEVIQDYFTNERDSDDSDDSDVEFNHDKGKVHRKNRILTMQRIRHTIGHKINVFFLIVECLEEDLVREEEIHTDGAAADQMGETERESDVEVDAEVTEAQAEITDAEVEVTDAEAEIAEAEITDAEAEVAEVENADAEVDAEVTEALAHVSSISDINVELSSHDI